jgi:hypothetical protein
MRTLVTSALIMTLSTAPHIAAAQRAGDPPNLRRSAPESVRSFQHPAAAANPEREARHPA